MDEKKKKQLEAWNRTRVKGTKKWLENRRKKVGKVVKKKRTKRVKLPSIKSLITKADSIFSLWIRNRDKKCVLCGKTEGLQNGHFIKRSKKSVRWDEVNCNALCAGCNKLDNYEHDHYVVWFLREYGQPMYEDLLERSKKTIDLTREYLQTIIDKYK